MMKRIKQITKCFDCGYQSLNINQEKCSKCEGKLEILASENKYFGDGK